MTRAPRRLEIVELDARDDTAFAAWHATYAAAELAAGEGVGSPWQLEEVRALMQDPGTRSEQLGWSGMLDGEVVTVGWARLPLLDNVDRVELAVHTAPAHRRHGHGSAMLAHVEEVVRRRGRSVLVGEAAWAYAAGAEGRDVTGPEFARAHGYDLALGDVKHALRLPVDDVLLAGLASEAAAHHADFTLRSWVGPVPEELVEGWARLAATLMTEAPTGDLDVEPESSDPAVVREAEESLVRQGRRKCHTVALDTTGDLVAYTDLVLTDHEPDRAYQWGTLVRRDARGHRLGLAVKVANLRQLRAEAPQVDLLITYNAEVNRPMTEVNERLGFVPVARLGEFQKRT